MDEGLDVIEETVDLTDTEAEETAELETEEETEPSEEQEKPAEPPKQSAEENAKFAEIRRKYEADNKRLKAELEAERIAKKQIADEVVQKAYKDTVNPYTGKAIESYEDYQEYLKAFEEDRLQQAGLSRDYIDKMISENPIVKKAQGILEAQERQQAAARVDLGLAEISKLNPNIKTVEDLMKMPNREKFDEYVFQKGYDMIDAFKLVNPESHKKPSQAETKDHLIKLGGQESGGVDKEIPASELTYWKDSFPSDKPAELRARYNRALKRQGE